MKNQFERVLKLVRRTGDTMIVVDKQGDEAYVVMDLDQYEVMLGEKQKNVDSTVPDQVSQQEVWDLMQQAGDAGETWNTESMSTEELADLEQQYREFAARHVQQAIKETQQTEEQITETVENAQEFVSEPTIVAEAEGKESPVKQESVQNEEKIENFDTVETDDEFGEEQFYLEPIE